jgi:hypothetical protein
VPGPHLAVGQAVIDCGIVAANDANLQVAQPVTAFLVGEAATDTACVGRSMPRAENGRAARAKNTLAALGLGGDETRR